jgi:hypothetical protein
MTTPNKKLTKSGRLRVSHIRNVDGSLCNAPRFLPLFTAPSGKQVVRFAGSVYNFRANRHGVVVNLAKDEYVFPNRNYL